MLFYSTEHRESQNKWLIEISLVQENNQITFQYSIKEDQHCRGDINNMAFHIARFYRELPTELCVELFQIVMNHPIGTHSWLYPNIYWGHQTTVDQFTVAENLGLIALTVPYEDLSTTAWNYIY